MVEGEIIKRAFAVVICEFARMSTRMDGWMNQAYNRLSTTHGHITDCNLLVCMYWTRLVLVRPAASLWVPWGGEVDKPKWPWGGDLDTGKLGLSNLLSYPLPPGA